MRHVPHVPADSRQFRSEYSFKVQYARAIRRLSPASYRYYYDSKSNIRSSCFKQLSRRTADTLGDMLMDSVGPAGLAFSRWLEHRQTVAVEKKAAIKAALMTLPTTD